MALLILLTVIALVVWGITAAVRALSAGSEAAAAPTPTETAPADPGPCEPDDVEVDVAPSVAATGSPVTFAITLTNDGDVACLADAGRSSLVLTIESGTDRVWSSGDCVAEPDSRPLLLDVDDSTETKMTWNGKRSEVGCPSGLETSGAGSYRVQTSLDGARVPGATASFSIG